MLGKNVRTVRTVEINVGKGCSRSLKKMLKKIFKLPKKMDKQPKKCLNSRWKENVWIWGKMFKMP